MQVNVMQKPQTGFNCVKSDQVRNNVNLTGEDSQDSDYLFNVTDMQNSNIPKVNLLRL